MKASLDCDLTSECSRSSKIFDPTSKSQHPGQILLGIALRLEVLSGNRNFLLESGRIRARTNAFLETRFNHRVFSRYTNVWFRAHGRSPPKCYIQAAVWLQIILVPEEFLMWQHTGQSNDNCLFEYTVPFRSALVPQKSFIGRQTDKSQVRRHRTTTFRPWRDLVRQKNLFVQSTGKTCDNGFLETTLQHTRALVPRKSFILQRTNKALTKATVK